MRIAVVVGARTVGHRTAAECTELTGECQPPRDAAAQARHLVGQITRPVRSTVGGLVRAARQQSRPGRGQVFCCDVEHQRLLAEIGDVLQMQAMPQALVRPLDTSALVVALTEAVRRDARGGEVDHQHARLAAQGHLVDNSDGGRLARALPLGGVARPLGAEDEVRLERIALDDAAQGDLVAAAGVAAHDEADAALIEQVDEPGGRIAAVRHQHVGGAKIVLGVGEHRPIQLDRGAGLRVPREFCARTIQGEQALIGISQNLPARTSADDRHQHRVVGCHQPLALPACPEDGGLGTSQQVVVQACESLHMQRGACFGAGPVADATHRLCSASQRGEDAVHEFLSRGAAHVQQRRHRRWQWERLPARESREKCKFHGLSPEAQTGRRFFTLPQGLQALHKLTISRGVELCFCVPIPPGGIPA